MNLTKNTKIYKAIVDGHPDYDIRYRSLNVSEYNVIYNMKHDINKSETAYDIAIVSSNIDNISYPIKLQIGKEIISVSDRILNDEELLKLTVSNYRNTINNDITIQMISFITRAMPYTNIEFLLKQTIDDLIELVCIAEHTSNKKFFNFSNTSKTDTNKDGHKCFEEDGESLQEKMKKAQKNL